MAMGYYTHSEQKIHMELNFKIHNMEKYANFMPYSFKVVLFPQTSTELPRFSTRSPETFSYNH